MEEVESEESKNVPQGCPDRPPSQIEWRKKFIAFILKLFYFQEVFSCQF